MAAAWLRAAPGTVETVDHQKLTGDVSIRDGFFRIITTNDAAATEPVTISTNKVELARLLSLRMFDASNSGKSAKPPVDRSVYFKHLALADNATNIPPGVILINGSRLAPKVAAADETTVRFSGSAKELALSTVNVACIVIAPLPSELAQKISTNRSGALLRNGDFVDGDLKSLKDGRIKIESVLFGTKSFSSSQVAAIILRDLHPRPHSLEVQTRDGSFLRVSDLRVHQDHIIIADSLFAGLKISGTNLVELKRLTH